MNKQGKTIYLSLISIITVFCIVMGSRYHMFGGEYFPFLGRGGSLVSQNDRELETFSEISIESDIMDVTLKTGEEYSISYKAHEKVVPEYKIENGVLRITQASHKSKWWNGKYTCKVNVTVPQSASLGAVTIQSDLGDIKMKDIQTSQFHVDSDIGDVSVKNSYIGDMVLTADIGDGKFENCSFENMDIEMDTGDIKITGVGDLSDYEMKLYTDIGNVEVNGEKQKRTFVREGTNGKQIKIASDIGDIRISE